MFCESLTDTLRRPIRKQNAQNIMGDYLESLSAKLQQVTALLS